MADGGSASQCLAPAPFRILQPEPTLHRKLNNCWPQPKELATMRKYQETPMATIGRRDLLLLLIGLDESTAPEGLGGITGLQKMLHLRESEVDNYRSRERLKVHAHKAH